MDKTTRINNFLKQFSNDDCCIFKSVEIEINLYKFLSSLKDLNDEERKLLLKLKKLYNL